MAAEALHGFLATPAPPEGPDPLVGGWAVTDTMLPDVTEASLPLAVVNTGGAGQVAGPLGLAVRRGLPVSSVTTTVADPTDPAGNIRRIVAAVDGARSADLLGEDVIVRVGLAPEPLGSAWEAAADEIAAAGFEAALSATRDGVPVPPEVVVSWIDALLDRETAFAAIDVTTAAGVLGVLTATATLWDGRGTEAATAALASTDGPSASADLATGRRWCRSAHLTDDPTILDALHEVLSI